MSDTTIEWTDAVWNPVRGCSRVSEGCRNCYAEREAARIVRMSRGRGTPEGEGAYDGLVQVTSQGPKWTGEIRELMEKLDEPIRWQRPRRIFVNSMSDLFHESVSDVFIADVFAHMAYARQHTFQVLTKRPQRMLQLLTSEDFLELYDQATGLAHESACEILGRRGEFSPHARRTSDIRAMDPSLPRPNIWLGVSVEDQATADERIPLLLQTPAAIRFLSCEPLLGPVCLTELQARGELRVWVDALRGEASALAGTGPLHRVPRIDWVIVGGESGPGARPMHPEWARSLRDQCATAGAPFLFKQWGEWLGQLQDGAPGHDPMELNASDVPIKVGKKAAGRRLDGVEHNGFPEVSHA